MEDLHIEEMIIVWYIETKRIKEGAKEGGRRGTIEPLIRPSGPCVHLRHL